MLRKADPRVNGCPSEKGLQPRCILVSLGIIDISFSMDLKSVNCKKKGDSLKHVNTSFFFIPAMDLNMQLALSFHQEHMAAEGSLRQYMCSCYHIVYKQQAVTRLL